MTLKCLPGGHILQAASGRHTCAPIGGLRNSGHFPVDPTLTTGPAVAVWAGPTATVEFRHADETRRTSGCGAVVARRWHRVEPTTGLDVDGYETPLQFPKTASGYFASAESRMSFGFAESRPASIATGRAILRALEYRY